MGKGDIKTAKGKRIRGTYGITRSKKSKFRKFIVSPAEKIDKPVLEADQPKPTKKSASKKTAPKKTAAAKKTTTKKASTSKATTKKATKEEKNEE